MMTNQEPPCWGDCGGSDHDLTNQEPPCWVGCGGPVHSVFIDPWTRRATASGAEDTASGQSLQVKEQHVVPRFTNSLRVI